ncbi:hypothetical protein TNCV_4632201 [Trichonephila clavipes]|nr:hypothetical protein TNCV_4632201 [Trichonephila clavipes]
MHPVATFGAHTPASSISEGGHYGCPALCSKITGTSKIRFQIFIPYPEKHQVITFLTPRISGWEYSDQRFRSGLTFCVPTSASLTGATVGKYYGRPALSARATSVARGNENPDMGLECKAFPPNSGLKKKSSGAEFGKIAAVSNRESTEIEHLDSQARSSGGRENWNENNNHGLPINVPDSIYHRL